MKGTTAKELTQETMKGGIFMDKADLSILLGATSEIIDGIADAFYDTTMNGIYSDCHSLEERTATAARYLEHTFDTTCGAVHLMQFLMQKLWAELDYIEFLPHKQ